MKTILVMILITISIYASDNNSTRELPNYIVDVKSYSLIDSKEAFFIIGSRKHGIMKKNFAFAQKEDAQKYVEINGGCVVDYNTYVKMSDKNVEEYVKEHGIVIAVDKNTTKSSDKNVTIKKNNSNSGIYSKENMQKYKF